MTELNALFEISFEVCNKVGGIHTVISTKAATMVERLGDQYVAIGPWLLADTDRAVPFDEDPGYAGFSESCREMGLPVRVGRWRIPGRPLTILIEFSSLIDQKDDLLSTLWEEYGVDSLSGEWDYIEPVLFGWAAGRVIERWWEEFLAPYHRRTVVHAHEWMTGSALLYLKNRIPSIGTVFTTHATMLGRALSSLGHSPDDGLGDAQPDELAEEHGVVAKHSIEGALAREADVFTTVSEITAKEAELLHGRAPDPLLPNGIDLDVVDRWVGEETRERVHPRLRELAARFLGEDPGDSLLLAISGRYEFHNKGIDLVLDALARMRERKGRPVVLFVLVPAGNSGLKADLAQRLEAEVREEWGPMGLSTHNLFDEEKDPVHEHCRRLGLDNASGSRVKVIQVPIYLGPEDGLWNLEYEAVLGAMDLTCFPSYYEPWGYTPQESLAVGVPTVTTDYAGFGRWANQQGLLPESGITVLPRVRVEYEAVVESLVDVLERFLDERPDVAAQAETCRKTAALTEWKGLVANYDTAYKAALLEVSERQKRGVPQARRPRQSHPVQAGGEDPSPRLSVFHVSATLPEKLVGLRQLARNFWWCWDPEGAGLFAELSPVAWELAHHNPVQFLMDVFPEDLGDKASDRSFVARVKRVEKRFEAYVGTEARTIPAASEGAALSPAHPIAYFCAEFGLQECLRIYSGGLGVLAGDHLKSASDLNLPFVAVGLFYRLGYMVQRLNDAGEQIALDIENDATRLPMRPVRDASGELLEIVLRLPSRDLYLRAWCVEVGRVTLYLLDSDTPANREEDRRVTHHLYGGDSEMRLKQEIVLGRGGARLLRALDIQPAAYHINEGHAAFLTLERVSHLVRHEGLTFEEAREFVRSTTVFTTHTPVPAGHDRFGEDLMRRYFSNAPDWVGVPWERFYALGRDAQGGDFNMTYLALSFASVVNGVSRMHGAASRELLHPYWPGFLQDEVPVTSVTNGIHLATWTHPGIAGLLGAKDGPVAGEHFEGSAADLDPKKLWAVKCQAKGDLCERVKATLKRGFLERHDSPVVLTRTLDNLDEKALWIGFARRFAPYKRAHLFFQDPDRLERLLNDPERPVRILVAGKAHPADEHGQSILKRITALAREERFQGRVVFVEDYDMNLARALVQGVDVWLNTPTRMLEASGTSGMKAAANGALNLSIGDGWWPEGYDGENGWMIGNERAYEDQGLQDQLDAGVLYRLLEEEVVPTFFERNKSGLPTGWVARMKKSLETIPGIFNTDRMVGEYLERAYLPLAEGFFALKAERWAGLRRRVREEQRIRKAFSEVQITAAHIADLQNLKVGDSIDARVEVALGELRPQDLAVELVLGHGEAPHLEEATVVALAPCEELGEGAHAYEGAWKIERSGHHAYGIRVRARDEAQTGGGLEHLLRWA